MNKQDKIKLIKKLYKEGKIKRLGKNSFEVSGSVILREGITARNINEILK